MMCAVSVRQITPGSYEEFRKAWEPDPWLPNLRNALVLRHEDDPEQVLTIGFFEGGQADLDALRDDPEFLAREEKRLRRIAQFEEHVLVNGIYELVEDVAPPAG